MLALFAYSESEPVCRIRLVQSQTSRVVNANPTEWTYLNLGPLRPEPVPESCVINRALVKQTGQNNVALMLRNEQTSSGSKLRGVTSRLVFSWSTYNIKHPFTQAVFLRPNHYAIICNLTSSCLRAAWRTSLAFGRSCKTWNKFTTIIKNTVNIYITRLG